MKNLLFITFLILPFLVIGQAIPKEGTVKYLDYKRSFKEFTLGAPIESVMHLVEEIDSIKYSPGAKMYLVTDPEMKKISELVEIQEMTIITFEDKITIITLRMDKPNGTNLHKIFIPAFGGGYKLNQFRDEFAWKGKKVLMVLDYGGLVEDSCIIADLELNGKMTAFEASESKKALSDF